MTLDIVRKIDEDIIRLTAQRDELSRQIAQYAKARAALIRIEDEDAPLAEVVPHKGRPARARPSQSPPEFRPLAAPGPDASQHERTLHKVLDALTRGAETSSEVLASISLPKKGLPHRIQVANAIRDLKARGLVEETGQTGEPISGRGRAPKRLRVVPPPVSANSNRHGNGVRRSRG